MQKNLTTQVAPVRNTVLFINGNPVRYKIYQSTGVYFFHPVETNFQEDLAPLIVATRYNGSWTIEDLRDQNLIDQVVEDLDLLISEPKLH